MARQKKQGQATKARKSPAEAENSPATKSGRTSEAQSSSESGPPKISRRRLIVFRTLAVVFPFLLLLAAEIALSIADYGHDTRLVVPLELGGYDNPHKLNEAANYAYYSVRELSGPEPRVFSLPKPDKVYRIVVLGASTVEGFPYLSEVAFPQLMGTLLQEQLDDRQFEVLNAGIVGINSFAMVDLVKQVCSVEPDLVILYTGHNEFYGPGGVGSNATFSSMLYPLMTRLRRFRSAQWLANQLEGGDADKPLIESLARDVAIELDSATFQQAESFYRANLTKIAATCSRAKVPIMMCSVACNLSSQSPMAPISSPGLTSDQAAERDEALRLCRERLRSGQVAEARQAVDAAEALDDRHALVAYRTAQVLEAEGKLDEADQAYRRARDLDGCRFRAPSSFAGIVKEVVAATNWDFCYFLDLEKHLDGLTPRAAPGDEFFMEHVHFGADGQQAVARLLARAVMERHLRKPWKSDRELDPAQLEQRAGVTPFDHLMATSLMYAIAQNYPLKDAADSDLQVQALDDQLRIRLEALPPAEQQSFAQVDQTLAQSLLVSAVAVRLIEFAQYQRALELFQIAQRRRPWLIEPYVGASKCYAALQNREQALQEIQAAMKLAPKDAELNQIYMSLLTRP